MKFTTANNWTVGEKILLALIGVSLALACFMQFYTPAGGSQEWLLQAEHMWFSGGKFYVDIIEVNPPLILWIYAVPVFLSRHLHILTETQFLALGVFFMIAFCIGISDALISLHPKATKRRRLLFALLLSVLFLLFINPLYCLDREHILTILTFPYLLRFAPSVAYRRLPLWLSLLIGVMAGIGFCIKPHCAVVFAGIQFVVLLRERRLSILWSMENQLIYVFALFYLLAIAIFTPEYYTVVLPMALATYSAYNNDDSLIFYGSLSLLILAAIFIDFRIRYQTPYRKDIYYFLSLTPFLFIYALLNNGWAYTYIPLNTVLLLLTGLVLIEHITLYREQGIRKGLHGAWACMLVLLLNGAISLIIYALALYADFDGRDHNSLRNERLASFVRNYHAATYGAMLGNFGIILPLEDMTGAKMVTRFSSLWMLPRFISKDNKFINSNKWILAYVAHAFADDLRHHKPDVVFVDVSPSFFITNQSLNVPALLSAYPDFKEEWSRYHLSNSVYTCRPPAYKYIPTDCNFDLYRRIP